MREACWNCLLAFLLLGLCPSLHSQDKEAADRPEQQGKVLAVMEVSGGFAGVHEKYEVYLDGTVINPAGLKRRAPASLLDSVRRNIAELDPGSRPGIDLHDQSVLCSDCFQYRITIFSPEGRKFVIHANDADIGVDNQASVLARSIRELVFGLKWQQEHE